MQSQSGGRKPVAWPDPGSGTQRELRAALTALRDEREDGARRIHLDNIQRLVSDAWLLPGRGRNVASAICRELRLHGTLELLLEMLQRPDPGSGTRYAAGRLLEQVLVTENRDRLARTQLPTILQLASEREDTLLATIVAGILQHMFKHSETTARLLVINGGLDFILYWCRSTNAAILRHCATALANCAVHGGRTSQRLMVEKRAAAWLFPLAFSADRMVQFQACLAITVLAANKELEREVERSGTLDLVEPFIASLQPDEFVQSWLDSAEDSQGRTAYELQRLVQLLDSSRQEAQCVAAFYLCVEAGVKAKQYNSQDFKVDGDLLLLVSDSELKNDLGIQSSITRRRFLRELRELKMNANYSTCDPSNLADWLGTINPLFRQYTYNLVHCGIRKETLSKVTEEQLMSECHIENRIHRAWIYLAGQESLSNLSTLCDVANNEAPDVFISYRRSTGSQLASLLKVHLQLRGFSVFLDVEKLEAGTFEDKLVESVKRARNFVLVLSANALDKCMGDMELKDWVHKEIVIAMSSKKNIVPIIDQFSWPDPNLLPEDMRSILKFNGVQWAHEYQDASVEKILRFLQPQTIVQA
ncbi:NAD(+) hydrolase SARM1 isoform X2 [Narcine bancroftii]|uniref:NAD(+) hydrolase SARM1 isoform X2 n=1 Tax=Narcine bancroftii TaxID=1343680 RepID=UPI0038311BAE